MTAISDVDFVKRVSLAIAGTYIETVKCDWKRGYYKSTYTVSGVSWEILHKGKILPVDYTQVYAIRMADK